MEALFNFLAEQTSGDRKAFRLEFNGETVFPLIPADMAGPVPERRPRTETMSRLFKESARRGNAISPLPTSAVRSSSIFPGISIPDALLPVNP